MRTKDKLEVYYAELTEMRQVCEDEKRQPTAQERQKAREVLDKIDKIESGIEAAGYFSPGAFRPPLDDGFGYRPGVPQAAPGGNLAWLNKTNDTGGFNTLGEYICALANKRHDPRIQTLIQNAMTIGEFGSGGALSPEVWAQVILQGIWETNPILSGAHTFPMEGPGSTLKIPRVVDYDHSESRCGIISSWKGELADLDLTSIKTGLLELAPRKLTCYLKMSREWASDAIQAENFARNIMVQEAGWTIFHDMIHGTGAASPQGFLESPCLKTINKQSGQLPGTLEWLNITDMFQGLTPGSEGRAIWLISSSLKSQALNLSVGVGGVSGQGYWPALQQAGNELTLLGRPVFWTEHLPVAGTKGDILLIDPYALVVAVKQPVQLDISEHVFFGQDAIALRLTARMDWQGKYAKELTLSDGVTTTSPFVCLEAR
jgi:HK97 family phage major capsid protein